MNLHANPRSGVVDRNADRVAGAAGMPTPVGNQLAHQELQVASARVGMWY